MHSKNQKRHISPVPSRSPLVPMKPKTPAVAPGPGDTLAFRVPKDYPHSRFSKAPLAVYPPKGARSKTCVSLPVVSLEKMPCLKQSDSASHLRLSTSSPSSLKPFASSPSQRSSEKLLNGRASAGGVHAALHHVPVLSELGGPARHGRHWTGSQHLRLLLPPKTGRPPSRPPLLPERALHCRRRWRRGTRTEPRAAPGPRNGSQGGCSIPTSTAESRTLKPNAPARAPSPARLTP
ncbi:hypothetical protein fugu_019668 [Takifugu bimaculatus]|uniref:Uncharacterized protein n=1 Tax=Takifugu bimaculatus TaxID=433685 RepID=A0A4Z2BHT8_9TELE|nr:hypothetical protein fugu_019668 [Takifugu bimaculatus]